MTTFLDVITQNKAYFVFVLFDFCCSCSCLLVGFCFILNSVAVEYYNCYKQDACLDVSGLLCV